MFAKFPSVQVTRTRSDFFLSDGTLRSSLANTLSVEPSVTASSMISTAGGRGGLDGRSEAEGSETSTTPTDFEVGPIGNTHTVYLGIGSNLSDRVGNISKALKELIERGSSGKTTLIDTSFLYESEAMYVKDQNSFLNAVIQVSLISLYSSSYLVLILECVLTFQIETELEPLDLLNLCKDVENALGRQKTIRNGPRVIDLDILLYDDLIYDSTNETASTSSSKEERWLKIPHASISEREFVLRPLAE